MPMRWYLQRLLGLLVVVPREVVNTVHGGKASDSRVSSPPIVVLDELAIHLLLGTPRWYCCNLGTKVPESWSKQGLPT